VERDVPQPPAYRGQPAAVKINPVALIALLRMTRKRDLSKVEDACEDLRGEAHERHTRLLHLRLHDLALKRFDPAWSCEIGLSRC
jgi:hypothetical protein